ncbi:MAG: S-methyl-5-thioribose-1-phosphate isomerase [Leptospiraceae bacterium]|nr:S-methyl-5-thioribose-1-phosphate isomerase [Leptospiraceae bacterium]
MDDWIQHRSAIWDDSSLLVIDQTLLPHRTELVRLTGVEDYCNAIRTMIVRGAPLIGVVAAYGAAALAAICSSVEEFEAGLPRLLETRPTAVNLRSALEVQLSVARSSPTFLQDALLESAHQFYLSEIQSSKAIGAAGGQWIEARFGGSNPIQFMTHCNAGRLATVEYGTATAPIYWLHENGLPVHVWVSETRPRNQGASLTAWELAQAGIPHTVFVDNAAGHIMQSSPIDVVLVGADRIARNGDTANKIGTYLKALAAREHEIPFLVAAPGSTFDLRAGTGREIPIEERNPEEVSTIVGHCGGDLVRVDLVPRGTSAHNPGFDITPSHLIHAFVTERGILEPAQITSLATSSAP